MAHGVNANKRISTHLYPLNSHFDLKQRFCALLDVAVYGMVSLYPLPTNQYIIRIFHLI